MAIRDAPRIEGFAETIYCGEDVCLWVLRPTSTTGQLAFDISYIFIHFFSKCHCRLALWDHGQTLKQVGCWQSQNWPSGNYPRTLCFDTRPEAVLLLHPHAGNCWHMQWTLAAKACNSSDGKVSSSRFRAVPLATPRQGHCIRNCHVRVLASGKHRKSFCSQSILDSNCPLFWHVFTWKIFMILKDIKRHKAMLWQKFGWKVCRSGCSLVEKAAVGIENRATTRLVSSCVKLSWYWMYWVLVLFQISTAEIFGTLAENCRWQCLGGVHFGPLWAWGEDIVSYSFTHAT